MIRLQDMFDDKMKRLFPGGGTALLAVSGGIDSMTLATLAASSCTGLRYAVAHCNFHLRGEESDGDSELVASWAEAHGMPFHRADFDTVAAAAEAGESIEMAARRLRYEWFANLCRSNGYEGVVVAHNANDNAETVMLNLLRGTGIHGLTGMAEKGVVPVRDGVPVVLVRPLLDVPRSVIADFAREHGVPFREDRTNASVEIPRNRIRNEVFPLFAKVNPAFLSNIARTASNLRDAEAVVSDWLDAARADVVSSGSPLEISIPALLAHPHARFLLFSILSPYGFTSSAVEDLFEVISGKGTVSGRRFVSGSWEAVTTSSAILVRQAAAEVTEDQLVVTDSGEYRIGGTAFEVEIRDYRPGEPLRTPDGVSMADADRLGVPFVVRRWKRGDWMRPLGVRGRKKLSDMFVDLRIPLAMKPSALVVASVSASGSSRVLALAGRRIDEDIRVTPATRRVVVLTLKK